MAGGTWTNQNKVRPGVYLRFKTGKMTGLTVGERGVVAIAKALPWGPSGVTVLEAGQNMTPVTGFDLLTPQNRFLQEIFKGTNRTPAPRSVLLYRIEGSGAAKASVTIGTLTTTARYNGTRGNDISIAITAQTEPEDTFLVTTIVDGNVADQQQGASVADLTDNAWVSFSGTGALTADTGKPLTGGNDGTVNAADYSDFLTAIEPYSFDVLIYDGQDPTIKTAFQTFVKRIVEESGVYTQLVAANLTNPDSRFCINVTTGVQIDNGTKLTPEETTWWVGGATAGARYNQDLTHAVYPGAVDTLTKLTSAQYEQGIKEGKFLLLAEDGAVKVEYDINSLVTYTPDIGEIFRYNRVMRLCNTIANDVYRQFSNGFIGTVDNNEVGRGQFKAVIVGYLLQIQDSNGIQNFEPDDVEVLPGEAIDAILVNIAIQPVGSVNKIYITIEVS